MESLPSAAVNRGIAHTLYIITQEGKGDQDVPSMIITVILNRPAMQLVVEMLE